MVMSSNDIKLKSTKCRCIKDFTVQIYDNNKFKKVTIECDEEIIYELRGNKLVKDGLYSKFEKDGITVTVVGDLSNHKHFTDKV